MMKTRQLKGKVMARGMLDAIGELQTLFREGSAGGLDDAQLLERFVARHEVTAEVAFRLLVERHGPRVLRVCRTILGDRHSSLIITTAL